MAGVERLIDVRQRLRLDALRGVDDQQRALAGRQRARDLIGEVDVPGRVHQVEDVALAVLRLVVQPDGLRLDGDAALFLDVHRVEDLLAHVARGDRAGLLDQPVGKRRLAVVDMGHDREIADIVETAGAHARAIAVRAGCAKGRATGLRQIDRCFTPPRASAPAPSSMPCSRSQPPRSASPRRNRARCRNRAACRANDAGCAKFPQNPARPSR